MARVVFLRAVNVGGRTLRPKALADELGLVNVGAAGTFVAPAAAPANAALERAIRRVLPFETEVMICPAEELLRLVRAEPFGPGDPADGVRRSITILASPPKRRPALPIDAPPGAPWEVRVVGVIGRYALSLRRRLGPRLVYPNEVIEKRLALPATTRGWETLLSICRLLDQR